MRFADLFRRAPRSLDLVESSLLWIVGSPRAGTTWLGRMLKAHPSVRLCDEPLIGMHLGVLSDQIISAPSPDGELIGQRIAEISRDRDDYFFSARYRESWAPALRLLLLERLGAQILGMGGRPGQTVLVLKEPHGSEGADLLGSVLPRSRLLFLVRDGRDVVDSEIAAVSPGSWASPVASLTGLAERDRLRIVEEQANRWVLRMTVGRAAYDAHDPSRRLSLRYEDLLDHTDKHVRAIYEWLGLTTDDVGRVVQRRSFDALPPEARGPGLVNRAASPGLWRQNLSADEQAIVNRVMRDQLLRAGYSVD